MIDLANESKCLSTIEWEGLQNQYNIKEEIRTELLQNVVANTIQLWRDENYLIYGKIIGGLLKGEKELIKKDGKAGERVTPSIIEGSNFQKIENYRLEHCYIGNINFSYELQNSGDYEKKYDADLNTYYVKKFYESKETIGWLTEWYLNGPRGPFWFMRSTERKYSEKFERNRGVYSTKEHKFDGDMLEELSRDYLFVQLQRYGFIIQKVPKGYGPSWSENIGIEYRQEFGEIPAKKTREAIAEIVSFIFGRHLLNIGYSQYDKNGNPIEQVSINPWGDNVVSYCKEYELSPIIRHDYKDADIVEKTFEQLVPRYLDMRDEFALDEVLWRYWIAESLPLGTSIPILHNGIEILANNWFKSTKSKTHGFYLSKSQFEQLLNEDFISIERKLNMQYDDRILNKIKGAFQTGANEKIEFFLQEIGLEIGEMERRAIRERNKMIHGSFNGSEEAIDKTNLLTKTYKTFFHRVFLKILGYQGPYIDYSALGWPKKNIDQVAGIED